ncbi:hypothetical protein A9K55_003631 [Cordyceps militaris]|uniref:Uncharacterized protein n=1 Tax=Cordyceps militaris TaxID=73501 RepID=A0A2H4S5I7_CORMI|nr:hypothetical protein A9K55_003631 [Cordyceps militaris]
MARNVARVENLIKKLNKADFCKVLSSSIRFRLANETESTDIVVSLRETIAEASISTPAPTSASAANSDQDNDKAIGEHHVSSSEPGISSQDNEPNCKRSEQTDSAVNEEANFDDSGHCQGTRKRRKHDTTCTRGNSGLVPRSSMIKPDPGEDLYNFWALCKSLRHSSREQELVQLQLPWVEQLPKLFDNTERRRRDAKSQLALNTLQWRLLAIDVARIYMQEKSHEDELRSAWRAMGHKVHGARDITLDLLTGRIYGADVNMYKLSDKDPRRKRVESWLRTGCPLLAFTNHFGFAGLIAPGMRIGQTTFKAKRAGEMETESVEYLINTFESSKEELSVFSQILENWVRWYNPPCLPFMVEGLSEASVRTQPNLSLLYWGQSDIAPVSGVTEGSGVVACI